MPLQAGSWLMSIFDAFGAIPSNLTVPFTVATVAGSMGVAAGAIAGWSADIVLAGCSSFLVQAAISSKPHRASTLTDIIQLVFLFMMSFFLSCLIFIG
jgi:nitrate reductase gamma subunit